MNLLNDLARRKELSLPFPPQKCQNKPLFAEFVNFVGRDHSMGASAHLNEDHEFALQLYSVLSDIDPSRWRDDMAEQLAARLERMQRFLDQEGRHKELADAIRKGLRQVRKSNERRKDRWLAFKKQLQPKYLELAERLKERRIHLPTVRPTNYGRSVFHAFSASVAVLIIQWLADPHRLIAIAGAWAAFVWMCELSRVRWPAINRLLLKVLGPIAHEHEVYKVNSATWYATALFLLSLTQSLALCTVGVVVLGFADPMAALIGRRYGRIRLVHGRSLEGSIAFAATGAIVTFLALRWFYPTFGLGATFAMSLASGLLGAIAELFSLRVDDNFTIPLSSAVGAVSMAAAFGVALT